MAVTEERLREYLRLPPDSSENVSGYLAAAQSKARSAGIPSFRCNAQYDLFILSLAAMYYENRSMAFSGTYQATTEENARKLINSFVLELRYAREDCCIE
mgnify:CR=1 FL=1